MCPHMQEVVKQIEWHSLILETFETLYLLLVFTDIKTIFRILRKNNSSSLSNAFKYKLHCNFAVAEASGFLCSTAQMISLVEFNISRKLKVAVEEDIGTTALYVLTQSDNVTEEKTSFS